MSGLLVWLAITAVCGGAFLLRVGWLLVSEARRQRTEKITYL